MFLNLRLSLTFAIVFAIACPLLGITQSSIASGSLWEMRHSPRPPIATTESWTPLVTLELEQNPDRSLRLVDGNVTSGEMRPPRREVMSSDEQEAERKKALPYRPDSKKGRKQLKALSVLTTLGEWRPVGPSNFGGKIYQVAVDATDGNKVYAAYEVGGLWGTHNAGQTWIPMFNGFQNIAFSSVRTHPTVSGLVAAGLIAKGEGYFTSFNANVGIVLSTNSGNTWNLIGPSSDPTATVWDLAFGDSSGQVIYAPTDRGLYKTTNQGQTWTNILAYNRNNFFDGRPSFAVDPLNSSVLLLAQQTLGIMRSTDGGSTWTRVDTWMNPGPMGLSTIVAWSAGATVYAEAYTSNQIGLATYKSTDEGVTWTATAISTAFNQGMYDMAIGVDPFNPSHVFLHNSRFQESNDGFATLSPSDGDLRAGPDCLSIVFDPSHQGVVYSGNDRGLHKSTDGGVTWTQFDVGVLTNKAVGGSAHGVDANGVIYTNPADYNGQRFVAGYGWIVQAAGYEFNRYYVNPQDSLDLYVHNGGIDRAPTSGYPGQTLDPAPSETAVGKEAFEFDPVDGNTIYFAKQNLYKSTNRGQSWSQLTIPGANGIELVKVAPSDPTHLYAVSNSVLYYSTNAGGTWTQGANVPYAIFMAVSPTSPTTVYVASRFNGLYRSTDGGSTAPPVAGFPDIGTGMILFDPAIPSQIFVGLGNGNGVLVSQDSGSTWQQLGTQLPLVGIDWLSIVGRNLYIGTSASVWEMNLEGQPPCSQLTFNPPSLSVPSLPGTYPLELFIAGNCPWAATSPASWATIQNNGVTSGHANLYVTVTDNTAGTSLRTTNLSIAGQNFSLTQFAGPDPVLTGNVVTLSKGSQCLTVSSSNLVLAQCAANSPSQQFTLQLVPGGDGSYFLNNTPSGQCLDLGNGTLQTGATIGLYGCNSGDNQKFLLQPQANGNWRVVPAGSLLCLNSGPSGSTQITCGSGTDFAITTTGPLQLMAAASRKTHGSAGIFDINLPLTGEPGIECRNSGDSQTLVFTFNHPMTSGSASVTTGAGMVSGSPTFNGNAMTVNLTGATNGQKITVTLSGTTDIFTTTLPNTAVSMNVLIGDTTADKSVNSADISQTKSKSGQAVDSSNFRQDVTVDGSLNSADISLVKSKSGTAVQ